MSLLFTPENKASPSRLRRALGRWSGRSSPGSSTAVGTDPQKAPPAGGQNEPVPLQEFGPVRGSDAPGQLYARRMAIHEEGSAAQPDVSDFAGDRSNGAPLGMPPAPSSEPGSTKLPRSRSAEERSLPLPLKLLWGLYSILVTAGFASASLEFLRHQTTLRRGARKRYLESAGRSAFDKRFNDEGEDPDAEIRARDRALLEARWNEPGLAMTKWREELLAQRQNMLLVLALLNTVHAASLVTVPVIDSDSAHTCSEDFSEICAARAVWIGGFGLALTGLFCIAYRIIHDRRFYDEELQDYIDRLFQGNEAVTCKERWKDVIWLQEHFVAMVEAGPVTLMLWSTIALIIGVAEYARAESFRSPLPDWHLSHTKLEACIWTMLSAGFSMVLMTIYTHIFQFRWIERRRGSFCRLSSYC